MLGGISVALSDFQITQRGDQCDSWTLGRDVLSDWVAALRARYRPTEHHIVKLVTIRITHIHNKDRYYLAFWLKKANYVLDDQLEHPFDLALRALA